MVRSAATILVSLAVTAGPGLAAQTQEVDLSTLPAGSGWAIYDRNATAIPEGVHLGVGTTSGVAWIPTMDFADGVIEVRLRGKDVQGESFVGIAFHGQDALTYEAIYLRPFNFRAEDAERRAHAIQYVAHPHHPWFRLRETHTGEYEKAIEPPPDPTSWVHLRIELEGPVVRAFVDGAAEPALVVDRIGTHAGGWVGLWVGSNSDGDFAGLRLTPAVAQRP